jgi:hypothetical protein
MFNLWIFQKNWFFIILNLLCNFLIYINKLYITQPISSFSLLILFTQCSNFVNFLKTSIVFILQERESFQFFYLYNKLDIALSMTGSYCFRHFRFSF